MMHNFKSNEKKFFQETQTPRPRKPKLERVSRDIAEHKRAEDALLSERNKLVSVFEAMEDGVYIVNQQHDIQYVNPVLEKDFGPWQGCKCYQYFHDRKEVCPWCKNEQVFAGKTVRWEWYSSKNRKTYDLIDTPLKNPDGSILKLEIFRDITERKQIEVALRESEQKYRALVEQSLQGIIILQDFRIVFANAAAAEIGGHTIEEVLALSLEDMMAFVPPEDRASILERLKNRFAGKTAPENYELCLERKNGDTFWLNLYFSPIEYQGKFAIQVIFVDITDQKRAQESLRRSEKRFREIFENTAVGVYRTTPDGRILMANPALIHMLGYSSFEELSQRNLEEEGFEPQYRRSMFREEIERKDRIVSLESTWITRDGKKLYVIENARAVQDEDGKILYYEGTAENITERNKAEEALRESEQRYRAIFEQAADSILLIDVETGAFVEFNDRAYKNLGYTHEEFRKLKLFDIELVESTEEIAKHLEKVIRKGTDTFETKHRTKNGEIRDVQISCRAISIPGKDFVQSIWHDITERKKAVEKLLEYQGQLKSLASQLTLAEERERRRIAIELHDEISQSLFISKMKVEALRKSASGKELNEALDEIRSSLGRMITDMRLLTFDLSSPVLYELGFGEAVAEWLKEQVEGKYGIETEFEDDGLTKPLDNDIRVLLFRNVRELLINVIKHARAKKIKVAIRKVGSRIRVSVEDDGLGFEPAKAESMITNKEAFGLFSIRERLEHLGGKLKIESAPGCGCRVTITSPLRREEISEDKQE